MKKHILIVGSNRSGTTWVGEMLKLSNQFSYLYEPFRGFKNLKVDSPIEHHFEFVTDKKSERFKEYIDCCISRYPISYAKGIREKSGILPKLKFTTRHLFYLLRNTFAYKKHFILKDPLALFSANWFKDNYDINVVVLLRHPAAYVSSIKRLKWRHDISLILKQTELVNKYLDELRPELEMFKPTSDNILEEATLRWKVYHLYINKLRLEKNDFIYLRHEDLSRDVVSGFNQLYKNLGIIDYNKVMDKISELNSNETESLDNKVHVLTRNSKLNITMWKKNLTSEELDYIRKHTFELAKHDYPESDW